MRHPLAIATASIPGLLAFPLVFLGLRAPTDVDDGVEATCEVPVEGVCTAPPAPGTMPERRDTVTGKTVVASMAGSIKDTLRDSVLAMGERSELAAPAAAVLQTLVDRGVSASGRFGLVYEKRWRGASFLGYGRILAASLVDGDRERLAIFFACGKEKAGAYYTTDGTASRSRFICPLASMRVSSRFSRSRFHPVLHRRRPHWGVDLAAPAGTPVMAAADGEVTFAGWSGGYGRNIAIAHAESSVTRYGHLQSIARGIKPGARVAQGQVIGYVGRTGLATGPHLDFRLEQKGKYVDPLAALDDAGATIAIAPPDRARFAETRDRMLAALRSVPNGAKRVVVSAGVS
ncbi:MAG: M23 family metallopeptidase [Acidobacteriota bacterium]